MCGVAGILQLDGDTPSPEEVRRMGRLLAHRGPDGEGLLELGPLVLGHRRLAIIDLSERAAQPMHLADEGLALSYNGELYNYLELRRELEEAGAVFRSASDTEVVLRAYARWGLDAFARFNGMWALALWDAKARTLHLSRDRFGIKPLYLFQERARLLFASEPKAILAVAPAARAVDEGTLGRFLAQGIQDDGRRTFFAGLEQLASATVLSIREGRRSERRFWRFSRAEARARYDFDDPPRTLRRLLEDAVRLRLRSDVPVGTCLSGGLDSSSLVALASQQVREPVRTFTAAYRERGYDERRFARAVVERFGCLPAEVEPRPGPELVELIERIGYYHDEPCARPGLITQWHVMQLAQGQVTVLLDGQGGDELLLGYAGYALPYLRWLARVAAGELGFAGKMKFWRDARGLLGQPSTTPSGPGTLLRHLAQASLARLATRRRPPVLARRLRAAAAAVPVERADHAPDAASIDRLLLDELCHTSIPALLHHEDRTSMAFSLEARVPFLDHRVVEFSLALDARHKVEGGLMKAVLRRALADLLPPEITARTDKLGYPTPLARWLREAEDAVKETLFYGFAERDYLEPGALERAWAEFARGRGDAWQLYRWLTTELWLQRCVDRPPAPPLQAPRPALSGSPA